MKLTFRLLSMTLILGILISSCKKDDDNGLDNIIGSWNADGGTVVATIDGIEAYNGDLTSTGSMTFEADSTGSVNLQFEFGGSTSSLNGVFNYLQNSNVITLNPNTANETQFTRIKNEKNLQELTFKQEVTSDNAVLDYVLVLRRQ